MSVNCTPLAVVAPSKGKTNFTGVSTPPLKETERSTAVKNNRKNRQRETKNRVNIDIECTLAVI